MSWDREEAVELYKAGKGPRAIARAVDGPYTSVWDYLQGSGVALGSDVKVLVADIETAPMRAFAWSRWKQNIYEANVISEGYVLCWAARWLGSDLTMTDSLFQNKTRYWRDPENDESIVRSMWNMLVVFHNGDRFDIPVLNTRFIYYGLDRPSPYKSIDTYKIAKRCFKFPSNALDSIAHYLGLGRKMDTGGMSLWVDCCAGDADAWEKMVAYCAADTELLEKVYLSLRNWDHRHPNIALYNGNKAACGVCGSSKGMEVLDNDYFTLVSRYTVYRCKSCRALSSIFHMDLTILSSFSGSLQ